MKMTMGAKPFVIALPPPATWDPATKDSMVALSNGNLTAAPTIPGFFNGGRAYSNVAVPAGKSAFEVTIAAGVETYSEVGLKGFGVHPAQPQRVYIQSDFQPYIWGNNAGGFGTDYGNPILAPGDVLTFLHDKDAGITWLKINGTVWSGDPQAGTGGMPHGAMDQAYCAVYDTDSFTVNFGTLAYPEAGFTSWDG